MSKSDIKIFSVLGSYKDHCKEDLVLSSGSLFFAFWVIRLLYFDFIYHMKRKSIIIFSEKPIYKYTFAN